MNQSQFYQIFKWSAIVMAGLACVFSIYHMPLAQLGMPFLLLALSAVVVNSHYRVPISNELGRIPLTDSFIFLAILLFGGDAAILFAAVVAVCVALRFSADHNWHFVKAALTVSAAFFIVLIERFLYGSALDFHRAGFFSADFAWATVVAIFVQSIFLSVIIMFDGAYLIKHSKWRTLSKVFPWSFGASAIGTLAAIVVAAVVDYFGVTVSVSIFAAFATAYYAFSNYVSGNAARISKSEQIARQEIDSRQNLDRFRSAFEHAAIGMALVSREGRWLQVNRSLCSLLGYPEKELLKTDFLSVTHQEDVPLALVKMRELLAGRISSCQMEKRYIHKNGTVIWVFWNVSLAHGVNQSAVHLIFQIQDITARKKAEEKLIYDAFHDSLTGIPNRALFIDHLKLAMARAKRREGSFAMVYLDLDRFKIINDSLGHVIGDQLLVEVSQRLRQGLRSADTIARLGGDEFTILMEDITDVNELVMIIERLQKELSVPFNINGREVVTTASIGITLHSAEYKDPEEMIRDADIAMYHAKSKGKARYEIFDRTMHDQAMQRLRLETDLRGAIEHKQLFLQYQPIVDIKTGRLCGFEALVRWDHPDHGLISPANFIPLAEETGLITQVGVWVLRQACHQMHQWQMQSLLDDYSFMSVNLSGKQFNQPDLIPTIKNILRENKFIPQNLKLEITESVVMENIDTATLMLNQLKDIGVQLSIDDFGTGYSSLSYLHRFPIDNLKIDRSFVTQMVENTENLEIVRTIISLAKNLGMEVVAEGIETNEQLTLLKNLGCHYGQGYLFAKPLDAKQTESFIIGTYPVYSPPTVSSLKSISPR